MLALLLLWSCCMLAATSFAPPVVFEADGGGVVELGLEELPAQWSDTILTEFTWIVPAFALALPDVLLPVPAVPVLLAVDPAAPALADAPVLPALDGWLDEPAGATGAGVREPVICTSWPTWLLS